MALYTLSYEIIDRSNADDTAKTVKNRMKIVALEDLLAPILYFSFAASWMVWDDMWFIKAELGGDDNI